ncbi:MAG: KUP/HAK/KT family potassium transporter, partial [Methanomicrobiales archaeon]|nr:KUP/HAK/KT family potassium transporter [Methanomicrobiales archaeon]
PLLSDFQVNFHTDIATIGFVGILAIFFRAYSLGGGTYTGIEAVANGMQIMREPKIETGKRTMAYMALSLAVVSAGLYLCYYLWQIQPIPGRTLNAVLANDVFGGWALGGWIALITIISEAALLTVAAQAGFIDGPRVMANMAIDSWLPRRFASLSERLTMTNGILLMGGSALLLLILTRGSLSALIVMYAINVFVTFSLSQFGMSRFFLKNRKTDAAWKKHCFIHIAGFVLCATILSITVFEKFAEGGWITLFLTLSLVAVCYLIHGHYAKVNRGMQKFDELTMNIPSTGVFNDEPVNPRKRTAIQLVGGYNGFGIQTFLSIIRNFPNFYENFIFVSVAVIDSGTFKGTAEIRHLEESVRKSLLDYVELSRSLGIPADYRMATDTDVVEGASALVSSITMEFPSSTCFAGQIIFRQEHPFQKILHNETAFAIQRRLQLNGITTVITPIQANI